MSSSHRSPRRSAESRYPRSGVVPPEMFPLEHAGMTALLDCLDDELATVERGGTPDYQCALAGVTELTRYLQRFHQPREAAASGLAALGEPRLRRLASKVANQHQLIVDAGGAFRALLDEVFMDRPTSRTLLLDAGRTYTRGIRSHLTFEKRSLFPVLACVVGAPRWRNLYAQCRPKSESSPRLGVEHLYTRARERLEGSVS